MYEKLILIGRLGKDPEMRYTPSGKAVASFSLATDRKDGETKTTVWYRITVWDKQAEIVNQYLKKGRMVLVEGQLNVDPASGGPRLWTDKEGKTRASFEVTARTVRFLGGQTDGGGAPAAGGEEIAEGGDEDVPF